MSLSIMFSIGIVIGAICVHAQDLTAAVRYQIQQLNAQAKSDTDGIAFQQQQIATEQADLINMQTQIATLTQELPEAQTADAQIVQK